MPNFETVPIDVAAERTVVNQRQKILQEYVAYIQQLPEGQAAKLTAGEGETLPMLRRRLGEAARAADLDGDGQTEIAVSCEVANGAKSGVFYLKQIKGKWVDHDIG